MKHLTKFSVYSITILLAYLISGYIVSYLNSYYNEKSYVAVAIEMMVILAVYYPIVTFLDKYIQKASKTYVKQSKSLHKNSKMGLLIGISIAFFVLFILFALVRELNVFEDFLN